MSTNLQKIPVKNFMTFWCLVHELQWFKYSQNNGFETISCVDLPLLFDEKKNTVQDQQWLEKCYGDSAPSKTTICRWYAEFKPGRTDTEDAERSGRPNEVVTPETIKKVHQIVFENR